MQTALTTHHSMSSLADGVVDRGSGHRGRMSGTRSRPVRDDRGRCGSACGEHSPVGFAERFAEMKSVSEHRKARILECNRPGS